MRTSNSVDIIYRLLQKVNKELGNVTKSADNPFFHSKYADLNAHLSAIEPVLEKHGLVLVQPCDCDEQGSFVESIVLDPVSCQFMASRMRLILPKQDMQAMGSAVTYARRYTLGSLFAMQAEDDDGNSASDAGRKPISKTSKPKPSPVSKSDDEF